MKKCIRSFLAGVLAVAVMVTAIPMQTVFAKPAALSKKDFMYTSHGEKMYFTDMDDLDGRLVIFSETYIKTKRGIKVGSKLSTVKSKYGNASKKKFDNKESFNKYIRQYDFVYCVNTSKWKNYVEYTYKKNTKNDRRLRFYLDKNNKVTAIVYIYKYKNYKLTNKTVDIGFSFKAPKGKKITTKTVSGKKVQVLPANTTIKYNKSKLPNYGLLGQILQVDTKGRNCAHAIIPLNLHNSCKSGMKVTKIMQDASMLKFDPVTRIYKGSLKLKKLGKYNYFKFVIYDNDAAGGYDKPAIYYFRLK